MSRDAPNRLLVLADHPSLHRGFATVAREVTAHLHARTDWRPALLGYYPPSPAWRSPGYPVTALEPDDVPRSARLPRLVEALGTLLAGEAAPRLLLCMGTGFDLACVVEALDRTGTRNRVRLVGYTPMDYAPLPVQAADLLSRFDLLVPYTRTAREAIEECAGRAGVDARFLGEPIPHGTDTRVFRPLPAAERRVARRELFGLGDHDRLVGYFGRNSGNKRVDLVLRLFALAATGGYATCGRCGHPSAGALDRDGRLLPPPRRCNACGAAAPVRGRPRDGLHLYLHTDMDAWRHGLASGGRALLPIAEALGVRGRLLVRKDLAIGRGDDARHLAARMAACDLHLLPYEAAGWELTVLETGACGVANVITEVASPPEYAHPFSRVVPVGSFLLGDDVRGLMDTDLGLRALLDLLDDEDERHRLGAAGPAVARALDWRHVGERWVEALAPLMEGP